MSSDKRGITELLLHVLAESLRNDVVIMAALVAHRETPNRPDLALRVELTIKLIDEIDAATPLLVRHAESAAADDQERKPAEPPVNGRHGVDAAGGSSEAKAEPIGGGATPEPSGGGETPATPPLSSSSLRRY